MIIEDFFNSYFYSYVMVNKRNKKINGTICFLNYGFLDFDSMATVILRFKVIEYCRVTKINNSYLIFSWFQKDGYYLLVCPYLNKTFMLLLYDFINIQIYINYFHIPHLFC